MELYNYPDELIFSARSREGMTEDTEGICTLLSDIYTKAIRQGWAWEKNRQQVLEAAFRTAILIRNCPEEHNQQLTSAILKECSGQYNPATVIRLVMAISLLTVQENLSERESDIADQMEQRLLRRKDATSKICRTLSLTTKGKARRFHTLLEVHPTPVGKMGPDTLRWIDECMEADDLTYLLHHYPDTEQQLQLFDRAMKNNLSLLHSMTGDGTHGCGLADLRQSIRDGRFLDAQSGRTSAGTAPDGDRAAAAREETEVKRLNHRLAELSADLHARESEIERWKSAFSYLYDQLAERQAKMVALKKERDALKEDAKVLRGEKEVLRREKEALAGEVKALKRGKTAAEQGIDAFIGLLRGSQLPPDITDRLPEEAEKLLPELAERLVRLFSARIVQVNKTSVYHGPTMVSGEDGTLNFYRNDADDQPEHISAAR